MIDERREAQASAYALGTLPPGEFPEFEAALLRELELQLLVRELRGTSALLAVALPQVSPPAGLKDRIMATIDARAASGAVVTSPSARTPAWVAWMPWAMAACFAILCVALISLGHALRRQAVSLSEELQHSEREAASLKQQVGQLQARAAIQATNYNQRVVTIEKEAVRRLEEFSRQTAAFTNQLGQRQAEMRRELSDFKQQMNQLANDKRALTEALATGGSAPGGGDRLSTVRVAVLRPTADGAPGSLAASAWSAQDQRGALVVEGLPLLPAAQVYQLWVIDSKTPAPVSGGVLPAAPGGVTRVQFTTAVRVDSAERFAISIEPRSGVTAPTGKIVLASN